MDISSENYEAFEVQRDLDIWIARKKYFIESRQIVYSDDPKKLRQNILEKAWWQNWNKKTCRRFDKTFRNYEKQIRKLRCRLESFSDGIFSELGYMNYCLENFGFPKKPTAEEARRMFRSVANIVDLNEMAKFELICFK